MHPNTFPLKKLNTLNSIDFEYQIELRDNKTFVFFFFYFTPVFFLFIFTLIFPTPRYPFFRNSLSYDLTQRDKTFVPIFFY